MGILARGPLAQSAGAYPGRMPEMPRTLTAALHRDAAPSCLTVTPGKH